MWISESIFRSAELKYVIVICTFWKDGETITVKPPTRRSNGGGGGFLSGLAAVAGSSSGSQTGVVTRLMPIAPPPLAALQGPSSRAQVGQTVRVCQHPISSWLASPGMKDYLNVHTRDSIYKVAGCLLLLSAQLIVGSSRSR